MTPVSCLIIEDEPLAARLLAGYVRKTPLLQLAGVCADAVEAAAFLQRQPVQLLLLDLHLPELKGFDFLRRLQQRPLVIVITAYHQYALEGYELNVVDYLLKPVGPVRFAAAIQKVQERLHNTIYPVPAAQDVFIYIPVQKKTVKLACSSILYVESCREYVQVATTQGIYHTKISTSRMEAMLPAAQFVRIHRSFIVARNKVSSITATAVEAGGRQLPVGRLYRKALQYL